MICPYASGYDRQCLDNIVDGKLKCSYCFEYIEYLKCQGGESNG